MKKTVRKVLEDIACTVTVFILVSGSLLLIFYGVCALMDLLFRVYVGG